MTPLQSSWLTSMAVDGETVTLQTTNGKRLRYTGVPEPIMRALQTANSPGHVWRSLLRGRYGEQVVQ